MCYQSAHLVLTHQDEALNGMDFQWLGKEVDLFKQKSRFCRSPGSIGFQIQCCETQGGLKTASVEVFTEAEGP